MTKLISLAVCQADATAPPLAVLQAEASIPLCWLSLFELTDLKAATPLLLCCPLSLAQLRWQRRLPALLQWLGPPALPLLDGLSRWLTAPPGQQLQLQLRQFDAVAEDRRLLQQCLLDWRQLEQAGAAEPCGMKSSTRANPATEQQLEVRELFHPHTLEIIAAVVPLAPEQAETLTARLQQQVRLYPNLTPFLYVGTVNQPLGLALQQRLVAGQLDPLLAGVLLLALDHSLMSDRHYQALQFSPAVGLPLVAALTASGHTAAQFVCALWPEAQFALMLATLRQWLQLRLAE